MIRVLFICHGNICRSTMAQYVMQYLVDNADLSDSFYIDSAATSREEIGNPVHSGTRGSSARSEYRAETTARASSAGRVQRL